ncbi:MAG TPA: acyl-CoA dehydrogenase family protein [Pseudonocardiaceae bacterium]|nr:acyl-CoA dehydrogenase family protein [Pseudonocardiaceae bacterium]
MLERAGVIAEDVLFPAALDVDAEGVIPRSHFDLLAAEGFYGLAAPPPHSGIDFASFAGILETLCGGCLATTFTWKQHHSVVRGLTGTQNAALREKYLGAAIRGEVRGGVALAGAIPRPPLLWATATGGGWLLNGVAPFVSGWGIIDVLLIAARDTAGGPRGTIVSGLVDAAAGDGITVEELRLIAAQGSNTVQLCFEDYVLPTERILAEVSHVDFLANQHVGARLNSCLAMGVAGRCIRMIGEVGQLQVAARLHTAQDVIRGRLDAALADPPAMPAARAAASELAYRAAGALVVAVGSSGILHHQHAQRLVREATFTLVFAGRPEVKNALLHLFS